MLKNSVLAVCSGFHRAQSSIRSTQVSWELLSYYIERISHPYKLSVEIDWKKKFLVNSTSAAQHGVVLVHVPVCFFNIAFVRLTITTWHIINLDFCRHFHPVLLIKRCKNLIKFVDKLVKESRLSSQISKPLRNHRIIWQWTLKKHRYLIVLLVNLWKVVRCNQWSITNYHSSW